MEFLEQWDLKEAMVLPDQRDHQATRERLVNKVQRDHLDPELQVPLEALEVLEAKEPQESLEHRAPQVHRALREATEPTDRPEVLDSPEAPASLVLQELKEPPECQDPRVLRDRLEAPDR